MISRALVALIGLLYLASGVHGVIIQYLPNDLDDRKLVGEVHDQEAVKAFRKELDEFVEMLSKHKQPALEKLLGKPAGRSPKGYALPVAQPRLIGRSGRRYADEKLNKDHREFYPIEQFAGIEVWYGIDGKSPGLVLVRFKADKTFPKLTKNNLKDRLAWDRARFLKLTRVIKKRQHKK
jgi:hypothetical protein